MISFSKKTQGCDVHDERNERVLQYEEDFLIVDNDSMASPQALIQEMGRVGFRVTMDRLERMFSSSFSQLLQPFSFEILPGGLKNS